jgi:hypothetical protein
MHKKLGMWLGWFALLFILDFCLPFTVFARVPRMTGSFLFWILWICVAIISMFMIFLKWREVEVDAPTDGGQ